MLILLGLCDSNFPSKMFQASWVISVSSIAVCSSGDTHSSIRLYAELFLLCHSSISCVNDAVLLGVVGIVSVPRIMAYKFLSLAVARISLFHDNQLSLLNLGLMSQNLWMSCFGWGVLLTTWAICGELRLLIFVEVWVITISSGSGYLSTCMYIY